MKFYNNGAEWGWWMIVAIHLPDDTIEIITNKPSKNKFDYYMENYDDNMKLKSNNDIFIIDVMMV